MSTAKPASSRMGIDPATLRHLRESRAWSQEQLAEVAGLSVRTVQRVEGGAGASLETRMALATALQVDLGELLTPMPDASASERDGAASPGSADMNDAPQSLPVPADPAQAPPQMALVMVGIAILFALFLLFGYMFGRDIAHRASRKEAREAYEACIAAGRSDCR
ncbi:helix-turn-helix domain-containing protein [Luteimonas sp. e5]